MSITIIPSRRNEQVVTQIPTGKINDLDRRVSALESGATSRVIIPTGASYPASPSEGQLFINTTTNEYAVYYGGSWQVLHTLTAATLSYFTQEDGTSFFLLEDGVSKLALQ